MELSVLLGAKRALKCFLGWQNIQRMLKYPPIGFNNTLKCPPLGSQNMGSTISAAKWLFTCSLWSQNMQRVLLQEPKLMPKCLNGSQNIQKVPSSVPDLCSSALRLGAKKHWAPFQDLNVLLGAKTCDIFFSQGSITYWSALLGPKHVLKCIFECQNMQRMIKYLSTGVKNTLSALCLGTKIW